MNFKADRDLASLIDELNQFPEEDAVIARVNRIVETLPESEWTAAIDAVVPTKFRNNLYVMNSIEIACRRNRVGLDGHAMQNRHAPKKLPP